MGHRPELDDDVDLDPEHRRYVLDVHARLDALSHYELLGVARDAEPGAIRRAYFKLARVIHPDRYFGKNLGAYKPKLEAIFARMTQAYELLSAAEARARYDASLDAAPAAAAAAPVDPASAARRQAARAELEARLAESKQRALKQAEQHTRVAARALAAGDVETAAQAYREALRLCPDDPDLRATLARTEALVVERRCEASRRQAALEERHGRWAQAVAWWQRVLEARPDDREASERLAIARGRAGGR